MRSALRIAVVVTLGIAAGSALAANPPLANWPVPKSSAFGKTAFADIAPGPVVFVAVDPCRHIDTRAAYAFPAPWGPPSMPGVHAQRTFPITGRCGIPVGATAVSFNFTIWAPVTRGDIRIFPAGGAAPNVAALTWEANIQALLNAAIVPLGAAGDITVQVDGPGTIDLIADVNGYFIGGGNDITSGERLWISGSYVGGMIRVTNISSGGYGGYFEANGGGESIGVYGLAQGGSGASYGVKGYNSSSSSSSAGVHGAAVAGYGVRGDSSSNYGVYGYSAAGGDGVFGKSGDSNAAGVHGQLTASVAGSSAVWGEQQATGAFGYGVKGSHAGTGYGVYGYSSATTGSGAIGVYGRADSSADNTRGVYGVANAASGATYGVKGVTNSDSSGAAGVVGIAGGVSFPDTIWQPAGILGKGEAFGVVGKGASIGVEGCRVNSSTGAWYECGALGFSGFGVYSWGDYGGTGAKYFVEPHPADVTKQIGYIALEGPEAGTYFRGRGRIQGSSALIVVPESFRLVTEEEGLTVQITPIGRAASVGVISVLSMDLNEIVIDGKNDVEFSYLVQGVRKGYADMKPIVENTLFVPTGPRDRLGPYPERIKQRLVSLGVYHPDGTVNMQTAEQLGWAQKWREEERLRQQAQQQSISRAPEEQGQAPKR
jgi:hypothetical protein